MDMDFSLSSAAKLNISLSLSLYMHMIMSTSSADPLSDSRYALASAEEVFQINVGGELRFSSLYS